MKWNIINTTLLHKPAHSDAIPQTITFKQHTYTTDESIADLFNNYYATLVDNLHNLNPPSTKNDFTQYLSPPIPNSVLFYDTDPIELQNIISTLKNSKTCGGQDPLSNRAIKFVANLISHPLSYIINKLMKTGYFPHEWKITKILPTFKNGDKNDPSNYRPISHLSNLSKIFEKVIYIRIINFLDKYNILNKHQFGFRKNHSTKYALLTTISQIQNLLDTGPTSIALFIDFQKAFDTVNHEILLSKLHHYGIRGPPYNLIKSYLTGRYHFVQIREHESKLVEIRHGVPQGSILGPLLFLIYINDIPNCLQVSNTTLTLYADDTTILTHHQNPNNTYTQAQKALTLLHEWCQANNLYINLKKTSYILFKNKNKIIPLKNIMLQTFPIQQTTKTQFLGITLDNSLNWSFELASLKTKLIRINGFFYRIRHKINSHWKQILYYAFVYPLLTYTIDLMGNRNNTIKQLQTLQNLIIKTLFNFPKLQNTISLYKRTKILMISEILNLSKLKIMHLAIYHNHTLPAASEILTKFPLSSAELLKASKASKFQQFKCGTIYRSI